MFDIEITHFPDAYVEGATPGQAIESMMYGLEERSYSEELAALDPSEWLVRQVEAVKRPDHETTLADFALITAWYMAHVDYGCPLPTIGPGEACACVYLSRVNFRPSPLLGSADDLEPDDRDLYEIIVWWIEHES